jgi:LEA14-like dessication related protein
MKIIRNIGVGATALVVGVGLFCSFSLGLKEPKIQYEKVDIKQVTAKDTKVEFVYSVDNPNPIGLENIGADYQLYLGVKDRPANGTPPTASGNDVKFNVKANAISEFRLPMTINYEGFFKSAAELTRIVLSGQKTIPFVLETTFKLDLQIIKFNIPVEAKGELPLPEVSANALPMKLP